MMTLLLLGALPQSAEAARSGGRAGGRASMSRSYARPSAGRSYSSGYSSGYNRGYNSGASRIGGNTTVYMSPGYGGGFGYRPLGFGYSPFGLGGGFYPGYYSYNPGLSLGLGITDIILRETQRQQYLNRELEQQRQLGQD